MMWRGSTGISALSRRSAKREGSWPILPDSQGATLSPNRVNSDFELCLLADAQHVGGPWAAERRLPMRLIGPRTQEES